MAMLALTGPDIFAQTIQSNLDNRQGVVTHKTNDFSVSAVADTLTGTQVKIFIVLDDVSLGSHINANYFNPLTSQYEPLDFSTGTAQFGPVGGFPFADGTSDFRIIFDTTSIYDYSIIVEDAATAALITISNESVAVGRYDSATIQSTFNGRQNIMVGAPDTFNISVYAGSEAGRMVRIRATLTDSLLYDRFATEYLDDTTYIALPYNSDGSVWFGPVTGFPLADAVTHFRVTYDTATDFEYTLEILDVITSEVLASATESVTVNTVVAPVAPEIYSTLNGRIGLRVNQQDSFEIHTLAGTDLGRMVRIRSLLLDSTQYNDFHVSYFDGTTYQPLNYGTDGTVLFGPVGGFPLVDTFTTLRITYDSAGSYSYSLHIIDAVTGDILAVASENVSVAGAPLAAVISSDLNGRSGVITGRSEDFTVTIAAGSEAGELVTVRMQWADPALYSHITAEYFDGTTYLPLAFDVSGTAILGPPAGFLLADTSWMFRVSFDTVCTFSYKFTIADNSSTEIAVANENVVVSQGPSSVAENTRLRFEMFPNPASEELNIQAAGVVNVTIYDMHGRVVKATDTRESSRISVKGIAAGNYFVKVSDQYAVNTQPLVIVK